MLGVEEFSSLDEALRNVVFALCAPSVSITKVDDTGTDVENWPFTLTVESLASGGAPQIFDWVSPDDGAATAPDTKTVLTNTSGISLFQWTPGSVDVPDAVGFAATFTETLPPGWTVDTASYVGCLQRRTLLTVAVPPPATRRRADAHR